MSDQLLLLAGRDAADLLDQLTTWSATAPEDRSDPIVPGGGPARLAIFEPTERRLALAAKVLVRGTAFRGRNDVWFDPDGLLSTGSRVAFLFPGVEPEFAPLVEDVATHFDISWEGLSEGDELQDQGRGIVAVGRLLAVALDRIGVRPDAIAGHSLGEWTGQAVSGMVPEEALDNLLASLRPGDIEVSDVVFLALGCGVEVAEELVAGLDEAHVSHDNCPHQSIACAPAAVAEVVRERARERKVLAQELPFRSGFHSPLFAPLVDAMWSRFSDLPLLPARVPLWSATTCATYPDDADGITALSLRHLVEPVRFRQLTQRLHEDGVRAFVQVGTGSLIGFVDDTLRGEDVLTVSAGSAKHSGLEQLTRVAAALWSAGAAVDFAPLTAAPSPAEPPPLVEPVEPPPLVEPVETPTLVEPPPLVEPVEPPPLVEPVEPPPLVEPVETPGPDAAVLAEYNALLHEATDAARLVMQAATAPVRRVRRAAAAVPAPVPAAAHGQTPPNIPAEIPAQTPAQIPPQVPAEVPHLLPSQTSHPVAPLAIESTTPNSASSRQSIVRLDVESQPWWLDHAFFQQPDGWPCAEDTFPLVPMTGIVQMLIDEAEALVPGSVATRVESVRAFKWLAVDPPVDVRVRATIDAAATEAAHQGTTVVRTSVDGHARAVVHVATVHPDPPPAWKRFIRGKLAMPVPVEEIYTKRHLFHGPQYQGIRSIEVFGGDGVRGTLESQPAPGALLDNAGQLFGYWFACAVDKDRMVLPTTMDAISFFGPHPAPGTAVECVAYCTELTDDAVRADLELLVDGRLWCRIEGWEDRRFQSDDRLFSVLKTPLPYLLAEPHPGGWMLVREGWPDSPSRDLVMRRFLGAEEREDYYSRNPRVQRTWLLGRIAAKDAVRREVLERGLQPLFPVQVQVHNEESGRPVVTAPVDLDLHVSIAHSGGLGVALVGLDEHVGIDIELVAERSSIFESASLSAEEHALFVQVSGGDRDRELTRWWAAKEAAAKAIGTGLQGRPKTFEIVEVDFHHLRVGHQWVATRSLDHQTAATGQVAAAREEYIVAWTVADPSHG